MFVLLGDCFGLLVALDAALMHLTSQPLDLPMQLLNLLCEGMKDAHEMDPDELLHDVIAWTIASQSPCIIAKSVLRGIGGDWGDMCLILILHPAATNHLDQKPKCLAQNEACGNN
jgi:hypothetical protein